MSLIVFSIAGWGKRLISTSYLLNQNIWRWITHYWKTSYLIKLVNNIIIFIGQSRTNHIKRFYNSMLIDWFVRLVERSKFIQFFYQKPLVFIGLIILGAIFINISLHAFYYNPVPFISSKLLISLFIVAALVVASQLSDSHNMNAYKAQFDLGNLFLMISLSILLGCLSFEHRGEVLLAAILLLVMAAIIWRNPLLGLWFFLILLPFHHLMMTILSEQLYLNDTAISLFKAWKDWIILIVTSKAVLTLLNKENNIKLGAIDIWLILFIAMNLIQAMKQVSEHNIESIVYSLRLNFYFIACFYFGRIYRITKQQIINLLVGIALVGVAAALVCIPEKIWTLSDLLVPLGYVDYLKHSFGQTYPTPSGLPFTFWLEAYTLRRVGSFFLGPLDMSYALLLIIPVTLMLVSCFNDLKLKYLIIVFVLLQLLAIGFAFSRAAISAVCLELIILAWYFRKQMSPYVWRFLGATFIILFMVFIAHDLSDWISRTASFQEASAAGHMLEWKEGVESLKVKESGHGLGKAGQTGARFDTQVTGENQYLIIGVELGIIGLLLFLLIKATVFIKLFALSKQSKDEFYTRLLFIAITAFLGITLVGLTSQVYLNNFLVYITWWLIGINIQKGHGYEASN